MESSTFDFYVEAFSFLLFLKEVVPKDLVPNFIYCNLETSFVFLIHQKKKIVLP